jgi:hypothetical protein
MVPLDRHMLFKDDESQLSSTVITYLDKIADTTKADIFLLDPEKTDDGTPDVNSKEQLKLLIFGDMLTKENAKVRILIMIDQMVSHPIPHMNYEMPFAETWNI